MFYEQNSIKRISLYNDIVEKQLSGNDYLDVILAGIDEIQPHNCVEYTHKECKNVQREKKKRSEKRLCHCLALYDAFKTQCRECPLRTLPGFGKRIRNAEVVDYEIPVADCKRNIDLLLRYNDEYYCVEFKPRENEESILRMVAEILTYCAVLTRNECTSCAFTNKYNVRPELCKKAILFEEDSIQEKEWSRDYRYSACDRLREIIREQDIAVLCLREGDDAYTIRPLD